MTSRGKTTFWAHGPAYHPLSLTPEEAEALTDLYRRGTPANTLRAWERDLAYISARKLATYNEPLARA